MRIMALLFTLLAGLLLAASAQNEGCSRSGHCGDLDTPEYRVLKDLDDTVQLRRYRRSNWVYTDVEDFLFEKATVIGFQRLFSYISGANDNQERIDMTSPVVTTVRFDKDNLFRNDFTVAFFLPKRYQPDGTCNDDDDTSAMLAARRAAFERRDTRDAIIRADDLAGTQAPAPRDGRVHIARFRSFDAYVLPFDGFAIGIRVRRLVIEFFAYLERNGYSDFERSRFQVAVYDPPYKLIDRYNEIWVFRTRRGDTQ